jgi:hypothetical protein
LLPSIVTVARTLDWQRQTWPRGDTTLGWASVRKCRLRFPGAPRRVRRKRSRSAAVLVSPAAASAADVYAGYSKIGSVTASYGGRYDVKVGYSRVGYVKAGYSGRWDVYESYNRVASVKRGYGSGRWDIYEGYSRVGYVKRTYSGRWAIYEGYRKVGEVRGGPGAAAAGAAYLLLLG